MAANYLPHLVTPAVTAAQRQYLGRAAAPGGPKGRDALTADERDFIAARDSFYLATVNEAGWPYVQHRGGPAGFLRVMDDHTLAFADYGGNRQLLSTGNLAANPKVSLLLMDYPARTRLKILGEARVVDAREHPEIVAQLAKPAERARVERLFFIDVTAYDWNCPQHITPRYTAAEVSAVVAPLHRRIAELEARLAGTN